MRKPDFFIVGAARSGTTSLYNYIVQHPLIVMSPIKEPHFFSEFYPSGKIVRDKNDYLSLFKNIPSYIKAGEASSFYLYSSIAAEQIKSFIPNPKIVILLRNPIDRAYSLYWHLLRAGEENLSFEKALNAEPDRIKNGWLYGYHYTTSGFYYDQVLRYLKVIGKENVNIFLFEDLNNDPHAVCQNIFSQLNIDMNVTINCEKIYNKSGMHKKLWLSRFLKSQSNLKRVMKYFFPLFLREKIRFFLDEKNIGPTPEMKHQTREKIEKTFSKGYFSTARYD